MLSGEVSSRLEALFAGDDAELAAALLEAECGRNLPFCAAPDRARLIERIRIAALKLSAGKLDALESAVAMAKQDWRDVLVAAGFGEDTEAHLRWWPTTTDAV